MARRDHDPQPTLGERLRLLRVSGRYSLVEVAAATDISVSFLSLVESGKSDLTIGRLLRLANFYQVELSDLLSPSATNGRLVYRRGEHPPLLNSPSERQETFLLAPGGSNLLQPLLVTFAPGGGAVERSVHAGEEFWLVLSGVGEVELEGHEPIRLEEGDTMCFQATTPHSIRNPGDEELRLLAVTTSGTISDRGRSLPNVSLTSN